jgi:hypothetical protein
MQTEIQTHWSYCKNYVCFPVEDVVRVLSFLILFIVLFPVGSDQGGSRAVHITRKGYTTAEAGGRGQLSPEVIWNWQRK